MSTTSSKDGIDADANKAQEFPKIKPIKQEAEVKQEQQVEPVKQDKLKARLKQLDQYKQIHKQKNQDASNSQQEEDEIDKEKIREVHEVFVLKIVCTGHLSQHNFANSTSIIE